MFTREELQVLRSSLNIIDIKGSNAKFIATLQTKIEKEFNRIQKEIEAGPPELQTKKENKKPIKKQ
tara:strand:+ start:420 stop:617 length:198 start_codon:yes stop_codon:yes gene_type:complete